MLHIKNSPLRVSVITPYDDQIPNFYRNICIRDGPASNALKDDVPSWTPANPVLLDMPPGFGKTTFVYDVLLPRIRESGGNLLLVSNRVALSAQQKRAVMDRLDDPKRLLLTDEGIRKTEDFGSVRIATYHRLPALLHACENQHWIAQLSYVIFDECHFFAADALFNENCDYLLKLATERFCRAVRIYMTGTSWDILVPLAKAEAENYHYLSISSTWRPVREFYRYYAQPSFDAYNFKFFKQPEDLLPRIKDTPADRWLIFVDQKSVGQRLCEKIGSRAAFLDANSKDSPAWNSLVDQERFDSQVLITTAVLDCGVNITDPTLKHIAVFADNRTSLAQMMGRKRLAQNEKVEVWVCDLSNRVISARYQQYRRWLGWYDQMERCASNEQRMLVAQRIWRDGDPATLKLFRLGKTSLFPNQLAHYTLRRRCLLFRKILGEKTTFREVVEKWLDIPRRDPQDELAAFCKSHAGQILTATAQNELRTLVCRYCEAAGHREEQPTRIPTLGARALNNRLEKLGLPYRIHSDKKDWVFQFQPREASK